MAHKSYCKRGAAIGEFSDGFSDRAPNSVNLADSPGSSNVHHNSGFMRMVRINGTTIILCPHQGNGDRTYRSTDNGVTWSLISTTGNYSGCLITGMNNYVYHFYINRDTGVIYMKKYLYNATASGSPVEVVTPVSIYSNAALQNSAVITEYRMLSANVDEDGTLYVVSHWDSGSDNIYLLKSTDEGATWTTSPIQVNDNATGHSTYCNLDVDSENRLFCTWRTEDDQCRFAYSLDRGVTWSASVQLQVPGSSAASNPKLGVDELDNVYVFVQGLNLSGAIDGAFVKKSTDHGATWGSWVLIEETCGYADCGFMLGSDGTLYVPMRSNKETGVSDPSCGVMSRFKLKKSADRGVTWSDCDHYYQGPRPGTRNCGRYQTWWNYGGPLEWTWCQFNVGETVLSTFYDMNLKRSIYNRT